MIICICPCVTQLQTKEYENLWIFDKGWSSFYFTISTTGTLLDWSARLPEYTIDEPLDLVTIILTSLVVSNGHASNSCPWGMVKGGESAEPVWHGHCIPAPTAYLEPPSPVGLSSQSDR